MGKGVIGCFVIGKHQHTQSELNQNWLHQHKIPVIRRISGGGTVFQGEGNLNFSFIRNHRSADSKIDFFGATEHIIKFLKTKGINVQLTGISNLTVEGKISGNAAHIHKNRSLHHGTLLFDADLLKVHEGIQHQSNLYQTKAIASNPAVVTNIQSLLKTTINLQQFNKELRDFIKSELNSKESRTFTSSEIKLIQELTDEKYKSWEWNFGYSPDFQLNRTLYFHNKKVDFQLFIHRGNIQKISCSKKNELSDSLCTNLIGVRHNFEDIQQTLYGIKDLKTASKNRLSSIAKELL